MVDNYNCSKEMQLQRELDLYNEHVIKEFEVVKRIDLHAVMKREVSCFREYDYNMPHAIFFIDVGDYTVFGRKLLSEMYRTGQLTSFFSSNITVSMFWGILKNQNYLLDEIIVEYYPLEDEERIYLFEELKKRRDVDIIFPYTRRRVNTREEAIAREAAWRYYENLEIYLARGESHIRRFVYDYLANYMDDKKRVIIYDPACSTGDFLRLFKERFNNAYTIAGDVSKDMVKVAKSKVDFAICEDACESSIADETVDIVFLRFLNHYVLTRRDAINIYRVLRRKIKKDGLIIAFGHTPLLLYPEEMAVDNLYILNRNGYDEETDSIFQFYVLKRGDCCE